MSVIFQTSPPPVLIHLLPKDSQLITYRVDDLLTIAAWMPDKFASVFQERPYSNDDFYHDNCSECERNCSSFIENHWDEELDEVDWSQIPGGEDGHCNVYDEGYHGQYCPNGNEPGGNGDIEFDISNMVFEISLIHLNGESERYMRQRDSAFLQAAKNVSGNIHSTWKLAASNVFGTDTHPGGICWGHNYPAQNLREIVTNYLETPFNNDLLNLTGFERNCDSIREAVATNQYRRNNTISLLCDGKDADALMIVDAEQNIPAFFTMLSAGFNSLPESPHVMLIPIKECTFERDGATYEGYKTVSDAVDKNWFVSKTGLLVGQI